MKKRELYQVWAKLDLKQLNDKELNPQKYRIKQLKRLSAIKGAFADINKRIQAEKEKQEGEVIDA